MDSKVQEIIGKEIREKTGILDFYECPLQEWPEQIFEMKWLTILNMSANYRWDEKFRLKTGKLDQSIGHISKHLESLDNLEHLCLADHRITKIEGLDGMTSLSTLYLSNNIITKVEGLDEMTSLSTLYLSNNRITKVEGLDEMTSLRTLYLNNNRITKIEGLDKMMSLSTLFLSNNIITKVEGLDGLTSLSFLDLSYNSITKVEGLDEMTSLSSLDFSNNRITKIEDLDEMTSLSFLDFSNNSTTKVEGLDGLTSLNSLNFSNNRITKVEGLDEMTSLSSLDFSNNSITKIEGLDGLTSLSSLDLSYNSITKIEGLDGLTVLSFLDFSNNIITKIEGLEKLTRLKALYLEVNKILKIERLDNILYRLDVIDIRNNPITDLEAEQLEIVGGDVEALQHFLSSSKQKNTITEIELPVKIILIGNSEAGKTTLCKELIPDKAQFDKSDNESTHGLKIRNWSYDGNVKALLYDFGGQDYYHASYQMFFSTNAYYLLLWDSPRKDNQKITTNKKGKVLAKQNEYISYSPDYWIENIWYYQKNNKGNREEDSIKITTVQNLFEDQIPKTLFFNNARENAEVNHQFQIALRPSPTGLNKIRLSLLSETLKEEVRGLKRTLNINKKDNEVISQIISKGGGSSIKYERKNVSDFTKAISNNTDTYLQVLHLMGLILYYHNIDELKGFYWIDPSSVSMKIYEVLGKLKSSKNIGKIKKGVLEKKCPDSELSKLMETQEIIFYDAYEKLYIIPQYLPENVGEDPLYEIATQGLSLGFSLKFTKFVPHGMMSRIICRFGPNPFKKHYYRYEIIFNLGLAIDKDQYDQKDVAKIRIKLDPIRLQLDISVSLPEEAKIKREDLYLYLFQSILAAYWNKPHLSYTLWDIRSNYPILEKKVKKEDRGPSVWNKRDIESFVPRDLSISIDKKSFVVYNKLRTIDDKNNIIEHDRVVESKSIDPTSTAPKFIKRAQFNPFVNNESEKVKSVFISYSHDDLQYRKDLQKFLINLERDNIIEIWQDGQINPGMDWDKTIKSQMEKADIVILLVSQNFIASNYVHHVEMQKAFKQMFNGQTKILPVLLSECDWEEWNVYGTDVSKEREKGKVGNYQFTPVDPENDAKIKPINKWQHPEDAWKQIITYIRNNKIQ